MKRKFENMRKCDCFYGAAFMEGLIQKNWFDAAMLCIGAFIIFYIRLTFGPCNAGTTPNGASGIVS